MKKLTSLLLVLCLALSLSTFTFASEAAVDAALTAEAVAEVSSDSASMQEDSQIKNIIFMIPDGGGPTLMDLADMVKRAGGFDRTKYPNSTDTTDGGLHLLPYLAGFETTRSANKSITDSAAGGTALSSGYKTNNGYVGVDTKKVPKANILEVAKLLGKAVGICTTAEWPHATPAAYTAHSDDRNDYINMYRQIENKEMDVVLGAGYGMVTKYDGATIEDAKARGYKIIKTPDDAAAVKPGDKLWGDVSSSSLPMDFENSAARASLPELTQAAITALSADEDGFFLMVEGSWVDGGAHNSNAVQATSEYLAFDDCWRIAVEFAKGRTDTVVIGAPDHDTGGLDFPSTMTNEVELIRNGTNPSTFTWTGNGSHTARNCPVWVYLPEGVEMLEGLSPVVGDSESVRNDYLIDNTDFAPYIAELIGGDLDEATKELFVDVTKIGTYMPTSKRFIFNRGDKYISPNSDTYYKNGEAIDMHGKVSVYVGGKFYVPAEMIEEEDWDYVNAENPDTIEGSGTLADPYLIDSVSDYKEFLIGLSSSTYKGKYFRQVNDLEFINDANVGIDGTYTFEGTYDGNGKTITWEGAYDRAVSLFPNVSGTIVNLGVIGSISSTSSIKSSSIAYTVTSTGKIINCFSQLDFEGQSFYGITTKNEGSIINTYYGGKASATSGGVPISTGGTYTTSYFVDSCGLTQIAKGVSEISQADSKDALASVLCGGVAKAQTLTDITLLGWQTITGLPVFVTTDPSVHRIRLYPESATAYKGSTYQFTANVDGKYDYSWGIGWSMTPQSELPGTYIDAAGVVHIDANETIESFTVMAKSKVNGGVARGAVLTIADADTRPYPVGSGTKEDPYIIRNEADFVSFTNAVIGGNKYKDKYFRQICDLDLAGYPEYVGMGSNGNFYGTYDGYGHTINVALETAQGCIFPYTWGTIMNLGSTGYVKNSHSSGGICRSLRKTDGDYGPGVIVNCWSSCDIVGNYGGGITTTNDAGKVINCAVYGNVEYGADGGTGGVISAGTKITCYFTDPDYATKTGCTKITENEAKTTLYATLNENIANAASEAGVSVDDLVYWVKVDGSYPQQTIKYPFDETVTAIEVLPEGMEMDKGEGRQLGLSPADIGNDAVTWSIESASSSETTVDEYGFVTVGSDETNSEIKVKAVLKSDTSVSDILTIKLAKELEHIAAYRAQGYEICYAENKTALTELVSEKTAPGKKVVFALQNKISFTSNYTLSHNGGTIVFTSAGGAFDIGSNLILGEDKDANIIFDNMASTKVDDQKGIYAAGNNITFTETFTVTSATENGKRLLINALADSTTLTSNGNTVTVETPSKLSVYASGYNGNLTNGDVTYVFGKNANSSLYVAGKVGKSDVQAHINGNVKVIAKDNAYLTRIDVAEGSKSYVKGNLDIEINDNAIVTAINLNKKVTGNAYIDIKGGTVDAITVTDSMVEGKSVVKADTDNATVGTIAGTTYAVKYNGDLGDVECSEDYASVSLTPGASVKYIRVTNGEDVKEYNVAGEEVELLADLSALALAKGTTTVEFLTDGELAPTGNAVFNANGGAFADGTNTKTVETAIGEIPTAPEAPVYEGYIFKGWTPELTAITADGATYTATWEKELDHIAAYRAAGYEIIYADTNNKTTFKEMVNENTAPGKKVVFALMQNMGNENSFDIEPMGGTVVFTSAGGAFRFNGHMKFIADHDADIIFDNMTVTEAESSKEIIAYGNNITFTETFKNTTGKTLIVYANCNSTTESNGSTVTVETDAKLNVYASGATGNATNGDVTYIFGKNANASLALAGKVTKDDGRQTYVNGDVKVVVKDNATLSKIRVGENYSYLKGNLDIEIKDNANVSAINLDKKVEGDAYIDIKGGTVGPITVTDGMVTGKTAIKVNTDKTTLDTITGADYVVKYNGDLGAVEYSADYEAVALTPDASVKYVRVRNGESFKEYNVAGDEVTLLADLSALPISEGTTTVEFLTEGTEVYAITFKDGDTTETQMVSEGTVPTAPAWTKDGYTLSWDKEIVAATEPATYTAVWTKSGPVEVTGTLKVKFAREDGVTPVNFAKLYIYEDDTKSELVNTITLENSETNTAEVTVDVTLTEGTYYAEVVKNGYLTFKTDVTVTATAVSISEIKLITGDIKGSLEDECGDGIVDIDDLVRVLRGFADNVSEDIKKAVDINEDGSVNVTDIAFVKTNFGKVSE